MKKIIHINRLVVLLATITIPIQSSALSLSYDADILLMLAGPVSEAVQETVLLIRRGDNFISKDSLSISCLAGASAGLMVGVAPILGFIETPVGAPVGVPYIVGTGLLSCAMAIAGAAMGMGTAWVLQELRSWRDARMLVPPVNVVKPPKIQIGLPKT